MSAPDTNLDKQKRRHAGPLIGMAAGVTLAGILIFALFTFLAESPGEGEADIVPSPDVADVVPEGVEIDELESQAPITVAPDSEGPPTVRGGGRDGELIVVPTE
ncbi:hypothetical protein [Jannaschia formosa]|uniref:hypothetical protein n=1 Tax=Jannaschia formosa TaxID=2259592 RepID=UPI000E1BA3AD|nr:hypothetical protein [Jannaschia formosa]TFL19724.1 hypothetical protein DR046_04255 [Jannaschia formosa]